MRSKQAAHRIVPVAVTSADLIARFQNPACESLSRQKLPLVSVLFGLVVVLIADDALPPPVDLVERDQIQ